MSKSIPPSNKSYPFHKITCSSIKHNFLCFFLKRNLANISYNSIEVKHKFNSQEVTLIHKLHSHQSQALWRSSLFSQKRKEVYLIKGLFGKDSKYSFISCLQSPLHRIIVNVKYNLIRS